MKYEAESTAVFPELESPLRSGRTSTKHRNALLLALAAPGIAELLSSSTPPLLFFVPWIFALFVLFYGGAAVLIREITLRWKCGWRCTLLLGGAFGILQEGISTRAFFDPAWPSLGPMTSIGYFLGVNWVWMFDAIVYHAVFSVALPILLVHQISPAYRSVRWLGRRGMVFAGVLFSLGAAVFVYSGKTRYQAPPLYLAACAIAILALCSVARRLRASEPGPGAPQMTRPLPFGALGFLATLGLILQIYLLPKLLPFALVLALALSLLVLITSWLLLAWSGGKLSYVQRNALLTGALGCFAVLGFLQEFNPTRNINSHGMSLVGAATLIGLRMLWKRNSVAANVTPFSDPGAPESPAIAAAFAGAVPLPPGFDRISPVWRIFEIVVSGTALIVTSPVMLLLGLIIRRGTPGNALFFQLRVGQRGRLFRFVKFRTLYADARQRFPELYAYRYTDQELDDLRFKIVKDPRVTPQGAWMRTTTLDELPNLWNVLTGDMALVGPRPEIPEMLPYYKGEMLLKFAVKPGVTGLAQISGRGRLSFRETVALDVEYVRNRSMLLDIKIVALTLYKMVTRDGAF